jgi:uncharacterized membrane protein
MLIIHVVLRLIHIFAGIFWAGVSFFTAGLLIPAVAKMGPEGGRFTQTFVQRTQLSKYMSLTAILTTAAGILLYVIDSGFQPAWITSGSGVGWTIGGLAGIAAFLHGLFVTGRASSRIAGLGQEIAAAGGPPSPAQMAEMERLQGKIRRAGVVSAALLAVAVLGMAVARYLPW